MCLKNPSIHYMLIFILIIIISKSTESQWQWKCKQNLCNRDYSSQDGSLLSLEMCRLVCGKQGAFWPIPRTVRNKTNVLVPVHPNHITFTIKAHDEVMEHLYQAVDIMKAKLYTQCSKSCSEDNIEAVKVEVSVTSSDMRLNWTTNERYSLVFQDSAWLLKAATFYGARHGLETFSQLIAPYPGGLVMVRGAEIKDGPYYPHRGLLLDTSRNYMSLETIKRQLDGMAASKLNYFHWHITDAQSFAFVSKRVPKLSKYGAYSKTQIYIEEDVKVLVDYARVRGIRILMEIDSPAHAGFGWQWGPEEGLGNLSICVNQQPWRSYCIEPPCGQLNPVNANMYDVLQLMYRDIVDSQKETDIFHMGGDEIFIPCWNASDEITTYLRKQKKGTSKSDFLDLWSEFQAKALHRYDEIVGSRNTSIVLWSSELTDPEVIQKYLSKERYVIETWVPTTDNLPLQLLNQGYRLIISTKDAWYLDHGFWGTTQYYQWRKVYMNKLVNHRNVLGGEVCMWSEFVSEDAVDGKIWPRAAAAAERLWSNPNLTSAQAESRFYVHRQRLVSFGIDADAVTPFWCYQNEGQCG